MLHRGVQGCIEMVVYGFKGLYRGLQGCIGVYMVDRGQNGYIGVYMVV